ncbi:MAG: 50S ribosomal protein L21 [Candidatus Dormibacter sp.]
MYAILSHGGRQYRVSAGDRLLVDRLLVEVGSVVALEPLLLTGGDGEKAAHGKDLDGMRVAATVVAHRRGKKLRIFKYKAKKRSRKVAGYRSDLTELRVESILAKGAALPKASAANGAALSRPDDDAGKKPDKPAATERKGAADAAEKPARAATRAAPRSDRTADDAPADDDSVRPTPRAGVTTSKLAAKPKTTPRATKAAPKATRPGKAVADAHDKETGDGA